MQSHYFLVIWSVDLMKREVSRTLKWTVASTISISLIVSGSAHAIGDDRNAIAQANLANMVTAFDQQFPEAKLVDSNSISPVRKITNPFVANPKFASNVLAKAQPDECFAGIGIDYPEFVSAGLCPEGSIPKTNQAYVWGMASTSNSVWYGTGSNTLCLVEGAYLGASSPTVNDSHVCEFGSSAAARASLLPGVIGDLRKPHMYRYVKRTKMLTDVSASLTGTDLLRLNRTVGLRSAGVYADSVVYLAGPSIGQTAPYKGINIFAFSAKSGSFLGSTSLEEYTNIRSWVNAGSGLYAGVANRSGGGSVLRFDPLIDNPFNFTVVGSNIDGEAAELAVHKDRIYASTWPNPLGPSVTAALWMSPKLPRAGLTSANANSWSMKWNVSEYEPDPVVAKTYGGGAMYSYKGDLYWGTMHVPYLAALAKWNAYGPATSQEEALADVLGTYRAISLFRVDDYSKTSPKVELLYGQPAMPVWQEGFSGPFGSWTLQPSGMGIPKYGLSGFGNPFNNYTWSMRTYGDKLYIGTMDWSYLALPSLLPAGMQSLPVSQDIGGTTPALPTIPDVSALYGADLWSISSSTSRAKPESISGVGNSMNYGIRTMTGDSNELYLGTANPMNLSIDGGWELVKVAQNSDRR